MTWIIIAVILLFILGSITWIMPSPEDRRRMKLRNQALEMGFRVKELKGQRHEQMVREAGDERWYIYWMDWPVELIKTAQKTPPLWLSGEDSEDATHPLAKAVKAEVKGGVAPFRMIYCDAQGVGGIWDERGKPEVLQQGLERLRQAVTHLAQISD